MPWFMFDNTKIKLYIEICININVLIIEMFNVKLFLGSFFWI